MGTQWILNGQETGHGEFIIGELARRGDYYGGDFGSVENCYGSMAAGSLFRWSLFAGSMQGDSCRGNFVGGVDLEPSFCQCCVFLVNAILP